MNTTGIITSVNIGLPANVEWKGEMVRTGIFKYPVAHAVPIEETAIAGDGQADQVNHGGLNKAVYVYAEEHYEYWRNFLQKEIEPGSFGENITTRGLLDQEVFVGDEYQFGTAVLVAVQPRMPCFKLGIRFNDARMTRHFFHARKNGIYFKVKEPGSIQKDDPIVLLGRSPYQVSIQDIVDNYVLEEKNSDTIRQILRNPVIPQRFRDEFADML